jgi:hypothetical protein
MSLSGNQPGENKVSSGQQPGPPRFASAFITIQAERHRASAMIAMAMSMTKLLR